MNPNLLDLIVLGLGILNYAFIILFIFYLLKIDYFNPIVKSFVNLYKPIAKISIFPNQLYTIFLIAIGLKFFSFYILYSDQYDSSVLGLISIIDTVNTSVRILFFSIIGSVILSWVAPNIPNPMLKIIDEISTKLLEPIRKFIPSAGGLDFSPIFDLILIRQIEILLDSIIRTLE